MKTGIIFDIDGTLWDATAEVTTAWNVALKGVKQFNIQINKRDMMSFMGHTLEEIGNMMLPSSLPQSEKDVILSECARMQMEYLHTHGGIVYENVCKVLRELKKDYSLYIVSNCPCGYVEALLENTGLADVIDDFEHPGNTGLPKGDNIKIIVERNNLDRAVYVGDTDGDYLACKAAKVPFIHAAYGYGTPSEPTPSIKRFDELPAKIKEVLA